MKPFRSRIQVSALLITAACASIAGVADVRPKLSAPPKKPALGINASLNGWRPFPPDNPWNTPIDNAPVDPRSEAIIHAIGRDKPLHADFGTVWNGAPSGIPYVVVARNTERVPVSFTYNEESDPGPYPIPPNAPIEGGAKGNGDRHILVLDRDNERLYELFNAIPQGRGYRGGSGAVFDLKTNALRPAGWTSADAAGLPIFPGLARYDETVETGEIRHALRFTVVHSRHAYVFPARHYASRETDPNLPPMGMRVRLKASVAIAKYPAPARVLLRCLKTYGMILADNGSDWFVSGAPDPRWDDAALHTLSQIHGSDFEVVQMGPLTTR